MLIIAVGFGELTDSYTCSCGATRQEVNPKDIDSVLHHLLKSQKLRKEWIDELLVVENENVIATYSYEDGLGPYQDLDEDA